MLLKSVFRPEPKSQVENPHEVFSVAISARRGSNPRIVGLDKAVMKLKSSRLQSLFPDDEHSHEPRRHVRFAALSQNSLPNSVFTVRKRQLKCSPEKKNRYPPSSPQPVHKTSQSAAVQALRKKVQSQQKSPETRGENGEIQQCLEAGWCITKKQCQREERIEEEQDFRQQIIATSSQQKIKTNDADYALYLYLASLYGPLETLLYCCCPSGSHGRVYMLLVDASARRLQRWVPKRVAALRRYWIGCLAQELSRTSIAEGVGFLIANFYQQRQAAALLQRLQLLRASRVLRAWREYSVRMAQLRDKIHLALAKDLESRFNQWQENIEARKTIKRQLKHTARSKAMKSRFDQWHVWCEHQKKLHSHLAQRWTQTKRKYCKVWCNFARSNLATKTLQRAWRFYVWRMKRDRSARLIKRVYRGWYARQHVQMLRGKMEIHSVLFRVLNSAAWEAQREMMHQQRLLLLEIGLHFAHQEAQCVVHAENAAAAFVTSELSKVIRSAMHRRLEEQIELLKQDDSVLPSQAAKNSSKLREMATQQLIVEQRTLARREAIATLRAGNTCQKPPNLSSCLICRVYAVPNGNPEDFGFYVHHKCLIDSGASVRASADSCGEGESWGEIARAQLTELEQREREHATQLLNVEPSIALLWRSMNLLTQTAKCSNFYEA